MDDKTVVMDDRTVVMDRNGDIAFKIDEDNVKVDRTVSGAVLRNVHEEIKLFISSIYICMLNIIP